MTQEQHRVADEGVVDAMPERGILITFEGGDGCGKSTHSSFLERVLVELGYDVLHVREPGATVLGERLREALLDPDNDSISPRAELLAYEAARAQLVDEVLLPALADGKVVICDRFIDSTVAYQGHGRGLDLDVIDGLNDFATSSTSPDATLVLHCSDRSVKRGRVDRRKAKDRLELAGADFHSRVISAFESIAEEHPERVSLIDTSGLHSDTAKRIFDALSELIPEFGTEDERLARLLESFDSEHVHTSDAKKVPVDGGEGPDPVDVGSSCMDDREQL